MKCPRCGTLLSIWQILQPGGNSVTCKSCGKKGRVEGIYAFAGAPMFLMMLFPFASVKNSKWAEILILCATLFLYFLAYHIFIRITWEEDPE